MSDTRYPTRIPLIGANLVKQKCRNLHSDPCRNCRRWSDENASVQRFIGGAHID